MSYKKTNQIIDELSNSFFIVEGEVTDLLTRETMQNLNVNMQSSTGAIAVGSALAGQIGNAALANFAVSDEGVEVSDFAIEITDKNNEKHYFRGCFPVVVFKKGDRVKVIAEPLSGQKKYMNAVAIIDLQKNYMWTSQEVARGRLKYRLWGVKLFIWALIFTYAFFLIVIFFLSANISKIINDFGTQIVFLLFTLLMIFMGWRLGASFDEQSIELEAILLKLGFNKPTMMSLYDFSVINFKHKNNNDEREYTSRMAIYTYRIDLAKKADEEKYGKK